MSQNLADEILVLFLGSLAVGFMIVALIVSPLKSKVIERLAASSHESLEQRRRQRGLRRIIICSRAPAAL
jgi:hypothetical protein